MKYKPLVSVIMCVYNEKEYMIEEAIQSVIAQTFKDWELIIVLDNPLDHELRKYLLSKKSSNIVIHINEKNIGAALSRNVGVEISNGKYIAILDGDDICVSDRLEKELSYLEAGRYDMICAGKHLIDEKGNSAGGAENKITEQYLTKCLPYINYITHSTVFMKKDVFNALEGYRDYPCSHDYELWLRLEKARYKIGYMEEDLVGYRIRSNSITGNKSYLQTIVCAYIRKLYKKNKSLEHFDRVSFEKYVVKYHTDNPKVIKNYIRSMQKRKAFAVELEKKRYLAAAWNYVYAILGSKIYRLNIYNSIEFKYKKVIGLIK